MQSRGRSNMGTSSSSKGSPGKVPMVPPWVPPLPPLPPNDEGAPPPEILSAAPPPAANTAVPAPALPATPIPIAPARRFVSARRSAAGFAASGSAGDLKRSLGHYVRKGYGGAKTATQRFGGTANNAGALYSILSPGRAGTAPDSE
jgi:hypothetical protein